MSTPPGSGPHAATPWSGAVETHCAVVYFAGDRAAKLKKPVDFGFVDFSTREAREAACHAEVELNRRFAPDVYLGVGDIVDEQGRTVDHLVLMRRMPDERRLSALVAAGAPVDTPLRQVARLLAVWHAKAPRGPEIDRYGTRDALLGRWTDSFAQVRGLPDVPAGSVRRDIDEIERLTLRYLDAREALFADRVAGGRIVDGHGDLLADDVFCLDDGPRVLDCLEFDAALRSLDGLDDAAFLAMDLERLGAHDLAERFLHWYVEFSGDQAPTTLWHHYVAYRAFVRAKVALLRREQGDPAAGRLAADYCDLTLRHLRAGAVKLVLVGGLPGTGKTTIADGVAERLGMTVVGTDRLRKEAAGMSPGQHGDASLYTPDRVAANYDALLRRAASLLERGESVVLDATWNAAEPRAHALALASRVGADAVQIRCTVSEHVAEKRLRSRADAWSDADTSVARTMAHASAPWPDAVSLDTEAPVDHSVACAVEAVRPAAAERVFTRRPYLEPD
ncbi:AAA family ATPase [Yinghuangia seranimata]|uniref:bifunctional aminoglycoside phosphotransferase/ATP-binding protein n=1 Tax=Yinghuangia seranimata TaxID=408067 RepID=UPI00248C6905|nr:bifunctional aminoglycoside phosphotransferase/ATP-binding protein [Yinghuangia seranimata]MDI2124790.1 AAA family ATPase [Yinghuangia seranimata]